MRPTHLFPAVHEHLLYEACPGLAALLSLSEDASVQFGVMTSPTLKVPTVANSSSAEPIGPPPGDLHAFLTAILPSQRRLGRSGAVLNEDDANRITTHWLDLIESLLTIGTSNAPTTATPSAKTTADHAVASTLPPFTPIILDAVTSVLRGITTIESSTGFSLLHIASIMNWHHLADRLRQRHTSWK